MESTTLHTLFKATHEVEIVRMTEEHLPEVVAIENSCFHEPWSRKVFRKTLEQGEHSRCLVALYQERVVGFIIAWYIPPYFEQSGELHIHNLAVTSGMRRKGIGKQLLLESVGSTGAISESDCPVHLEVRETNSGAQAFYRSLGFRAVGFRPQYYQDEGAILMEASSQRMVLHKQRMRI